MAAVTDSWIEDNYQLIDNGFAKTILKNHHQDDWEFIKQALFEFKLYESDIKTDGGNKTKIARRLEIPFKLHGWRERNFYFETNLIDEDTNNVLHTSTSTSHKIDAVKDKIAIEFEWNNKDTFFARDLSVLGRLHANGVIDLGIIITRSSDLKTLFDSLGTYTNHKLETKLVKSKYGESTTHTNSVEKLITSGTAGGCPILVIGINENVFVANGEIQTDKR
jgi:hypothetical protein